MGFLRTLGRTLFGGSVMGNLGNEGSLGRSATIPRATPPEPTEYDEIAESERAIAEDRAAKVLDEWSEDERRVLSGERFETPQSSNVAWYRYLAANEELHVGYKDGSVYAYFQMSVPEMMEFHQAGSKGGAVWDQLRIRGTALGHKKPYSYFSGTSGDNRKWNRSSEAAAAHGREADRQSANPSAYVFGKGGLGKKRGKGRKNP